MGKMDELEEELARKKAEVERRAAVKAGKIAVKTAWTGLVAAVSGVADSVLSSAEKELDDARAARGNTCRDCWYNCRGEVECLYRPVSLLKSLPTLLFDHGKAVLDRR